MDKFVAKANIENYRRKLAQETDETKHKVLARLLAEEEAKLASRSGLMTLTPRPPVGWAHVNLSAGFCVGPSAEHPSAWKHKCVRAVVVYDGQLQVLIKRRTGDIFPHKEIMGRTHADALIQITNLAPS